MLGGIKKLIEIYNLDFKINLKKDLSPITLADSESNKIICRLKNEFPKIPIISEENKNEKLNTNIFFG